LTIPERATTAQIQVNFTMPAEQVTFKTAETTVTIEPPAPKNQKKRTIRAQG
jgi:hypothetical protein